MSLRFQVDRHIAAPPERVWALLTTGALAGLFTKAIPDMSDSFELFADGLKAAAESAGI